MANDPLPLPDISAEPSPDNGHGAHDLHGAPDVHDAQDAEYEAIHAEIAATERGRWFLSEHVKRNRAADTDQLVSTLARAEAAMRGDAAAESPGASADDLAKLAAAIGQVEAMIAASVLPAAGGLAASKRIQDIAFALRQRETEPALCDELESALFDLGDAFAQQDSAAQRAQSAAALLRSLEASISTMVALAAGSPGGGSVSAEVDSPAPVTGGADESSAVEAVPSDSAIGEPAVTEPVEPPATESETAAHPGSVTPSMWETAAVPNAEALIDDLGALRDAAIGAAEAFEQPVSDLHASTEIVSGSLSGEEAVADDALPPALSEEAVVSELLPEARPAREEAPNSAVIAEQSSEESTVEPSVPAIATAEEAEPALEFHAAAANLAAEVPANDENRGIIEPAEDDGGPPAAGALETTWSAADDVESLLEAEPVDPPPTAAQPAGAQEDLDDLFEPLPPEPDVQPAPVSAVQREPWQQTFSPELPAPAFSGSATQIEASPAEPPPLLIAPAPAARAIPRPAPNDPLAAVRALSEEELIALFS